MRRLLLLLALVAAGCGWSRDWDETRYLCPDGTCPPGQECRAGRCEPAGGEGAPPWWNEDYTLRRPLFIDNLAGAPLPAGMAIGWVTDLDDLVGINHQDIEIVRWSGGEWTELARFSDGQPDTDETVWFELDEELAIDRRDSRHWVYYGYVDSPAPAGMDPPDQFGFVLWDTFDAGAIDPAAWVTVGDITPAVDGIAIGPGAQLRTVATWAPGHAVDVKLNLAAPLSESFWLGFQRPDDDTEDDEPLALWTYRDGGGGAMTAEFWMSTTGEPRWSMPDVAVPGEDPEHTFTVARVTDGASYWHENEFRLRYQLPAGAEPNLDPIHVRIVNQGSASLVVERIRVRPAVEPPPALTLGPEDSL
ncbi:MAG TPA: hypothetical protein VFU21_08025 [Kofleriaceae bacterium]|nr:hypothetical protein [Kofleriaceae bacterium]